MKDRGTISDMGPSDLANLLAHPGGRSLRQAWAAREKHFPSLICFDYPRLTLAISLTGSQCALDCAHCGGHYLRHMQPIETANPNGASSCLISGGCDKRGRVPVLEKADQVAAIRHGRLLNWHVGLITEPEIQGVAPLVDVVSFDFVGDDDTIREVYGLNVGVEAYVETYKALQRHATVIPHITIGLRGGRISGETEALRLLSGLGLEALVLLVFIPTRDTRYEDKAPPLLSDVAEFLADARLSFPDIPIHLGCMRPYGSYRDELDSLAVLAGLNRIVSPARPAVELAKSLGLEIRTGEECCVFGLDGFSDGGEL